MENTNNQSKKGNIGVPTAIIIAGIIIAVSIVYSSERRVSDLQRIAEEAVPAAEGGAHEGTPEADLLDNIAPVTKDDHIRGSLNAKITIIEYSDVECPFCKRLHPELEQVLEEYGSDQVAWVYRHLPLTSIHPNAFQGAEASECAAELGGNDAFWEYLDGIFAVNTPLSEDVFLGIADQMGLDQGAFSACLASGKYVDKINSDMQNAAASGGQGTPFNVVIAPDGERLAVRGAQPFAAWKQVIDLGLSREE